VFGDVGDAGGSGVPGVPGAGCAGCRGCRGCLRVPWGCRGHACMAKYIQVGFDLSREYQVTLKVFNTVEHFGKYLNQETLTEREGSVQLTYSLR
jgi:hypothetical protein